MKMHSTPSFGAESGKEDSRKGFRVFWWCGFCDCYGFPSASVVKNLPANAGDRSWILSLDISPGGGNGKPIPVFLPGKIPWTEEPGGLQSIGSQRIRHDWTQHNTTQFYIWHVIGIMSCSVMWSHLQLLLLVPAQQRTDLREPCCRRMKNETQK